MVQINLENWQSQLRKGLLDAVILNLLQHGRCHGYDIVQRLKRNNGFKIREGNIYPILARLETEGLLACRREASRDGPPRKYYELTEAGERAVVEMNQHLDQVMEGIAIIRKGV